jgi:hypothetical protein
MYHRIHITRETAPAGAVEIETAKYQAANWPTNEPDGHADFVDRT